MATMRTCDWGRIVREHAAPSVIDQEARAREASDRAQRERVHLGLPSDLSTHEQRVAHERRPSAFGPVRERAAGRDRDRFERDRRSPFDPPYIAFTSAEDTSAGAFGSWSQWQRDYVEQVFGRESASWFERMYSFATEPPEDPQQPTQRVFEGDLPEHYIDAGATGSGARISRHELFDEDGLGRKLQQFVDVAAMHAPWLRMHYVPDDMELRIDYARPCITDLPA